MVKVTLLDPELYWTHLVHILVGNFIGSICVFLERKLNLRPQKVLPHRVLKLIQSIVHESIWFVRINDGLLPHELAFVKRFSVHGQ